MALRGDPWPWALVPTGARPHGATEDHAQLGLSACRILWRGQETCGRSLLRGCCTWSSRDCARGPGALPEARSRVEKKNR
jgi:hypothetical protein